MKKKKLLARLMMSTALFTLLFDETVTTSAAIIKQILTHETAKKISEGKISLEGRIVDSLLLGADLNPDKDLDKDGLKTKQELYTYEKDSTTYYGYNSHPILKDSDGDGFFDGTEQYPRNRRIPKTDPLSWDISSRDMAMMMELAYRDDQYIHTVLDNNQPLSHLYENRLEYAMMHTELSPYWRVKETYHHSNGFDAVLFENKSPYPFIKAGNVQVLAIRGTKEANDRDDGLALSLGQNPKQTDSVIALIDRLHKEKQVNNLYITGHSLGGYLTQRAFTYAHQKGYTWAKKSYTFNAPQINGFLRPSLTEAAELSDRLMRQGKSIHYTVANDSLIKTLGGFEGNISIGRTQRGHSSRSYFEASTSNNIQFVAGRRHRMDGSGYRDPLLNQLQFTSLAEADVYTVQVEPESILEGQAVNLLDNISNRADLPDQVLIQDVTAPGSIDNQKFGKYTASIELTFPDQSKKLVAVPVEVHQQKVLSNTNDLDLPQAIITDKVLPFETIYLDDPSLLEGQEVEEQAGQNGLVKVVTISEQVTEIEVTPKTDRIVRIGRQVPQKTTAPATEPTEQTAETSSNTTSSVVEETSLPQSQNPTEEQVSPANDTLPEEQVNSSNDTYSEEQVEPSDQIHLVQEEPAIPEPQVTNQIIPFETTYVDDPTLPKGQMVEETPGQTGHKAIVTIGEKVTEIEVTSKQDQIIRLGSLQEDTALKSTTSDDQLVTGEINPPSLEHAVNEKDSQSEQETASPEEPELAFEVIHLSPTDNPLENLAPQQELQQQTFEILSAQTETEQVSDQAISPQTAAQQESNQQAVKEETKAQPDQENKPHPSPSKTAKQLPKTYSKESGILWKLGYTLLAVLVYYRKRKSHA
ncbi:TPA: G5 domain-containing protein, partial [Streptococcus suis]